MDEIQKGNPHQLTRNQHIFPIASLLRFCDDRGTVEVFRRDGRAFHCPPENPIFTAQRLWDQQAETGYPRQVEDAFQQAADSIIASQAVDANNTEAVSNFYALLHLRRRLFEEPLASSPIENFVRISVQYDQDARERLEAHGVTTITNDGRFTSQSLNGLMLLHQLVKNPIRKWVKTWGIIEAAPDHQFVVADRLVRDLILPLTPRIVLRGNWPSQTLSPRRTERYNRMTIASAQLYYFRRGSR